MIRLMNRILAGALVLIVEGAQLGCDNEKKDVPGPAATAPVAEQKASAATDTLALLSCDLTFWLDAHIKSELADWIGSQFKVIVKPLSEIVLRDAKDPVLFAAARRFGKIVIVTKDDDFVELVERLGSPLQVLWLTVGNTTTMELRLILGKSFAVALDRLMAGASIVEISR